MNMKYPGKLFLLFALLGCSDLGVNPLPLRIIGSWNWTQSVFDSTSILTPQSQGYSQTVVFTENGVAQFYRDGSLLFTKPILSRSNGENREFYLGSAGNCFDFDSACIPQTIVADETRLELVDSIGGAVHYYERQP